MSVLDAKIDERFVEVLNSSESVDEAIGRWAGVPRDEVRKLADSIATSLLDTMEDMNRQEAEVAVLKMLKPEATVRDYLVLRTFASAMVAMGESEEVQRVGGFDALLAPEPGKPSVVLTFPNFIIAMKSSDDVLGGILQMAGGIIGARTPVEAMLNITGTMATLGEPDVVLHPGDDIQEAIDRLYKGGEGDTHEGRQDKAP